MKRFKNSVEDFDLMEADPDGEWVRYSDHVEAMKRIAGEGAQQVIPVAEVAAGNLGSRLMWHTEDAQSLTPVGTLLYAAPSASAQQAEPVADVLDWLDTEISAVLCRYHGDPSYDHDAYWFKEKALKLVAEARKVFAAPAPSGSPAAQQAEKTVAAIDSALRGKVNDPDPLPKLHAHSVAGEPTTYGLVAGLLRERDALIAKVAKFDQRIVDIGVLAMETAAPSASAQQAVAWEYSFIHSSATGRADETVGPCLTYDRAQAYGVGCSNQRQVAVTAAPAPASPAALADAIKAMRKPKAPDGAAYAEYDKGYNKALSHVLERLAASPAKENDNG